VDLSAMLMPGVQKVVSAVLGDAWIATRDLLARRLGRNDDDAEQVARELEVSRSASLAPFAGGEPDRSFVEGFWYCQLARWSDERAGLLEVLGELAAGTARPAPVMSIVNSGTAEKLVQNIGDIHGGVTMG
jgi:hypothetical protein